MARNILLIEPNYKNKFPPIALMKLSTYHKRLGDNVVFYKGEFKDFILERISDKCVNKLHEIEPRGDWQAKKHFVCDFIKTRKKEFFSSLRLDSYESELLLNNWVVYYKDYYWKKLYLMEPEWDRVMIATLFTFYFDITVECINDFKKLVRPDGMVMVGGVLATLQPDELEKATGVKPHCGLLNKPGDLDADNDMIIDSLPLDYTILEEIDYKYEMSNAFYGSLTKGCIRHCAFCAVPKLEPIYEEHIPLKERIEAVRNLCGDQRDLLLMDNNVMASGKFDEIIEDIIESGFGAGATYTEPNMLEIAIRNLHNCVNDRGYIKKARNLLLDYYKSIKNKEFSFQVYSALENNHLMRIETTTKEGIYNVYDVVKDAYAKKIKLKRPKRRNVDFNQGVDARLFTPHMAKQFSRIAVNPLRIAFDNMAIKDTYINAIKMCKKEGLRKFSNYLLYNFNDDPIDLYRRLEINIKLCEELDVDIYSFPMKYHPLYDEHSHDRNYIGKKWNMKYIRAVQAVLNVTKGCIGRGQTFFYRAFGNTEKEYMDILIMPDTMILYRFFFEWLESKGHNLSKYKWQAIVDSLSTNERLQLIEYLTSEDDGSPQPYFIEKLKPFYKNLRVQIESSKGILHEYKMEFDTLSKIEKDKILFELHSIYEKQHKA